MKRIETRRTGIIEKDYSISFIDIDRHRRLQGYLYRYYRRYRSDLNFPQSIHIILSNIHQLCFVPCFFLSYLTCRFNELNQIDLFDLKNGSDFNIISSKGGHERTVKHLNTFDKKTLLNIDNNTKLIVVSYDHLRNSISKIKDSFDIILPEFSMSSTHIFRHLIASHLYKQNVSIDDISYKLGHFSKNTTRGYIHEL